MGKLASSSDTGLPGEGPLSKPPSKPEPFRFPHQSILILEEGQGHEGSLATLPIVLNLRTPNCMSKMLLDSAALHDLCTELARLR